jgi:hypothetical protein
VGLPDWQPRAAGTFQLAELAAPAAATLGPAARRRARPPPSWAPTSRVRSRSSARRTAAVQFEADAIERLPRVRTMAEASYRAGQGSIVELLEALDAITEARLSGDRARRRGVRRRARGPCSRARMLTGPPSPA